MSCTTDLGRACKYVSTLMKQRKVAPPPPPPPPRVEILDDASPPAQDIHRAVVLSRGRWDQTPTSLVGHAECTLTACFSPVIYRKQSAAGVTAKGDASAGGGKTMEKRPTVHHVVAVAGRDNVITVWLAAASRPLVIIKEVFQQPPSDVAWGADGYTLVVSGHDGSVVVLRFTADELGTALPEVRKKVEELEYLLRLPPIQEQG